MSNQRFRRYLEWGLIDPPENGKWSELTVGRLMDVHDMAKVARGLERRAVLMGTRDAEKKRKALLALIPLMSAPQKKMRLLEAACAAEESKPALRDVFGRRIHWQVPLRGWESPAPAEWAAVINASLTRDRFGDICHVQWYVAHQLASERADDLKGVALEEVILLVTIRELSRVQHVLKTPSKELKG